LNVVVDASVMVAALADRGERGFSATAALSTSNLMAPHLIDLEVAHSLRRYGRSDSERATTALRRFRLAPIARFDHAPLLPRIWELRHNLTAYDAVYVALAEATHTPLLTMDRRIANAPGHHAEVIVL
jgi:predicted nucleic acid-binding protein